MSAIIALLIVVIAVLATAAVNTHSAWMQLIELRVQIDRLIFESVDTKRAPL